jgi:hypothetical protein
MIQILYEWIEHLDSELSAQTISCGHALGPSVCINRGAFIGCPNDYRFLTRDLISWNYHFHSRRFSYLAVFPR